MPSWKQNMYLHNIIFWAIFLCEIFHFIDFPHDLATYFLLQTCFFIVLWNIHWPKQYNQICIPIQTAFIGSKSIYGKSIASNCEFEWSRSTIITHNKNFREQWENIFSNSYLLHLIYVFYSMMTHSWAIYLDVYKFK